MATPRTGRPRGRPKKNFLDDADRFPIAFAESLRTARGESERAAYDLAVALFFGEEVAPHKKPRGRRPNDWVHAAYKLILEPGAPATIAGRAATLRQKSKKMQALPEAQLWLKCMIGAFSIGLTDITFSDSEEKIRSFARLAGEDRFAEAVLIPFYKAKSL